jgi:hypothetical protein
MTARSVRTIWESIVALTLQEHNAIRASRIIHKPIPWDRILTGCAALINRPLSYDDASEILGASFMRFIGNSNDVQVWCVMHRLTFTPTYYRSLDSAMLSQIMKDVYEFAIIDSLQNTFPLVDLFKR